MSLVFAETAPKAKAAWMATWQNETDAEWTELRCHRQPKTDGVFEKECVIDSQHDLPEGVVFWNC